MKEIKGFKDYYITEDGKVFSKKRNIYLSPFKKQGGYLRVSLFNGKHNHKSIHRLVAEAFISNPNNYPEVNHIDGNKQNNNINNLEWCTPSQNQKHAFELGLQVKKYGEEHHNCKLNNDEIKLLKRILVLIEKKEIYLSYNTISKIFYNLNIPSISEVKKGKLYNFK